MYNHADWRFAFNQLDGVMYSKCDDEALQISRFSRPGDDLMRFGGRTLKILSESICVFSFSSRRMIFFLTCRITTNLRNSLRHRVSVVTQIT